MIEQHFARSQEELLSVALYHTRARFFIIKKISIKIQYCHPQFHSSSASPPYWNNCKFFPSLSQLSKLDFFVSCQVANLPLKMSKTVTTLAEIKSELANAGDDKLVVCWFFANWCPPCQRAKTCKYNCALYC